MSMETLLDPVWGIVQKAFLEECVFMGDDPSDEQRVSDFLVLIHSTGNTDYTRDVHPPTPRPARQPDSLPWESTRPQDKAYFWERIEAHCLLYGPNATSFTQGSSVPFLNVWNCHFQVMKSCQATKILSPQEQIILPRGSRWTHARSWYIIWLMFKKLLQTFARHQKGGLLHLLRQTVPTSV